MASYNQEISAPKGSEISFSKADEWRNSLASIAKDIQGFYFNDTTIASTSTVSKTDDADRSTLFYLQSLLDKKRRQIKRLNANVKTVCLIAKTVIAAKENESAFLTRQLSKAKNQEAVMSEKNKRNEHKFKDLSIEYQTLNNEMKMLRSFIGLGYEELQKINKESCKNLPVLEQLKLIIECCGQYYADYKNEHENCQRLEQKMRFLNSKICFLESTIISKIEELKIRRHQNARLVKENNALKTGYMNIKNESCVPIITFTQSHPEISQNTVNDLTYRPNKTRELTSTEETDEYSYDVFLHKLDLNNHLHLVKKLLRDQDCMLSELKNLSQELNTDSLDN